MVRLAQFFTHSVYSTTLNDLEYLLDVIDGQIDDQQEAQLPHR